MRSNVLLLLAVCSDLVTAGIVRRGPLLSSSSYSGALNQSSVPTAVQLQSSAYNVSSVMTSASRLKASLSTTGVSSTSSLPPLNSTRSAGKDKTAAKAAPSKQVGSVPVGGSGPGAAKISASDLSSANTEPPKPLATGTPNSSPTSRRTLEAAPSKQVGSVPAGGSGPGAAKISASDLSSANTEPPKPLDTGTPKSSPTSRPALEAAPSKQVGSVPAGGSGPGAAKISASDLSSANTEPPKPLDTGTPKSSHTSQQLSPKASHSTINTLASTAAPSNETHKTTSNKGSSAASRSGTKPTSKKIEAANTQATTSFSRKFSLISASGIRSTAVPRATGTSQAPATITGVSGAKGGNLAMAQSFNLYFKMIALDSTCTASINSQASACINNQPARCASDGKYVLSSCPSGQQCFALPLDNDQAGISIQCARPSDANAKLGQGQGNPTQTIVQPHPLTFSTLTMDYGLPSERTGSSTSTTTTIIIVDASSSSSEQVSTMPTSHKSKSSPPSTPSPKPQPTPSRSPSPSTSKSSHASHAPPPSHSEPPKPSPTPDDTPLIIITDLGGKSPEDFALFITNQPRVTASPSITQSITVTVTQTRTITETIHDAKC